VRRYRIWVGALHWGQLLLLVPSLLFIGAAVGVGAFIYAEKVGIDEQYASDLWVFGMGMLVWAFAWLTAFLSLWWWFGAREKSKAAQ
jgi:hypothetical protein